jgi:hypothetical protein
MMTTNARRPLSAAGYLLPGLLTLAFASPLRSQTITVDPPQVAPINILTINDLDFLNATTPKWLFTLSMRTQGTVQATMTISIDATLVGGGSYIGAVFVETVPFEINSTKIITNLDLVAGNPGVARHTVRQDAKQRLEETALPGGMIPAGMYRFIVTVSPVGGGQGSTAEFILQPTNPAYLQLRFPFDGDETATEFPLFEWFYDGPRSRISIYEQLPSQSSLEETASGVPQLTATIQSNSFQYPSSGVRSLQPGKTYAWFVEGLVDVSGGSEVALKSEIRSFRIPLPGAPAWNSSILEELEAALGPRYKSVFDRIRSEGLSPAGGISLNGSTISQSDLSRLLNLFRSNPDAVSLVEIE